MIAFTNALHADFISLPAQHAQIGSNARSRHMRELEIQTVELGPVQVSARLVTQAEWTAVMPDNPSRFSDGFEAMLRPVDSIDWHLAMEFCERLTAQMDDGGTYRLLREVEWEAIARCGENSRWHFGEEDRELDAFAWHAGNAGARTRPVGTKAANPLGFFDLYGNISEWCGDVNPVGAKDGQRVHRGGGWLHEADSCRSGMRFFASAEKKSDAIGMRLARVID